MRYNYRQEIASCLCITTYEYLAFLREQHLVSQAKLEATKKKFKDIALKKKKRLKVMALKKLKTTKEKKETKRKKEEMKLQREVAKLA